MRFEKIFSNLDQQVLVTVEHIKVQSFMIQYAKFIYSFPRPENYTPSVLNYKQKKHIFFGLNYKQKRTAFIILNHVFSKNYLFQRKIKCKVHSICSLFHFFYNQLPMKIVFTFSYKTYFKDNTKNYITNYILRSLI